MTREKIRPNHIPFLHFQNVYTKHNITIIQYYMKIYIIIGLIITGLALLFNKYWVKHDGDKPLTSLDVFVLISLWPIFLWYLFYFIFIKKDLDE